MVNRSIFSTRFCSKTNRVVSSGSNPWFEYFTNIKNRQSIRINNDSVIASNQSSFGNAIVSIGTRNKNPISIKYICHAEKTFCIEVKDNHNFIINGFNGLTIVGNSDGGSPGLDRFSGGVILDDLHKIDEAHSDTIRNSVISNYRETIQQRARGVNVPFIGIGQRVHEEDIAAYLLAGNDGYNWEHVVLKAIDDAGNALYPEAFPLEMLLVKQKHDPYVFSSQFQQQPVPPGGALFKPEWFVILDEEPEIIMTFITADTAETNKSWNDATVFSFWGLYDIELSGRKTGQLGLHWLDCVELRIEPKDLKPSFIEFWQGCMVHPKPPVLAAIEKKSTGVTLISVLDEIRGIQIRQIERTRASGSKTQRFLEIQPIIAAKRISFTNSARHVKLCIDHMIKITASDAHRWDDICDSAADAIRIALIDKTLSHAINSSIDYNRLAKTLTFDHNKVNRLKKAAYTR
jgi:predicted phage terminase large subunit-like protein